MVNKGKMMKTVGVTFVGTHCMCISSRCGSGISFGFGGGGSQQRIRLQSRRQSRPSPMHLAAVAASLG